MALKAVSNSLLLHAEFPSDIEALGTNDGITADHIAWIEEAKSWAVPRTISATTTVWNLIPLENPPTAGFYNDLQFYLDAANNLCNPDGLATFANDLRGNTTAQTLTNLTASSSRYLFNGSTSSLIYVKSDDAATQPLDDLFDGANGGTFLCWVRVDNHTALQKIVSTEDSGATQGWNLAINSSGVITTQYRFATPGNWNAGPSGSDLNYVNQWQMLVMTYDGLVGSDPKIYVDGFLRNTQEVAPPSGAYGSDEGNDLYFGDDAAGGSPLGGNIQMAMMWDRQLDANEIKAIYDATKGQFNPENLSIPAGIPRDDLTFAIDAGNQQSFPNGAASGIRELMGNAAPGLLDGVTITDSHMNFDGADDNITFSRNAVLDDLFNSTGPGATVMVWCRPETFTTGTLLSTRGAATNDGWAVIRQSSGNVAFVHDYTTVNYSVNSNLNEIVNDRWSSVTLRGVSNSAGFLIDGKPTGGVAFGGTGTAADDTGNTLYMGEEEAGTQPFDGDFDVVLIWNRQLSNAEVKQAHDVMRQRFIQQGMVLIDTLTATSGVTTLTFNGLNGNADGTYYLTGRVSFPGACSVEARPNGLTTNMFSRSEVGGALQFSSTTGLLLGGWIIPEGSAEGTILVEAWIYPEENKGGSSGNRSGRRMYRGLNTTVNTATPGVADIGLQQLGGIWDESTSNMTSLDIVSTVNTMETGTSFSLYFIEDAG